MIEFSHFDPTAGRPSAGRYGGEQQARIFADPFTHCVRRLISCAANIQIDDEPAIYECLYKLWDYRSEEGSSLTEIAYFYQSRFREIKPLISNLTRELEKFIARSPDNHLCREYAETIAKLAALEAEANKLYDTLKPIYNLVQSHFVRFVSVKRNSDVSMIEAADFFTPLYVVRSGVFRETESPSDYLKTFEMLLADPYYEGTLRKDVPLKTLTEENRATAQLTQKLEIELMLQLAV